PTSLATRPTPPRPPRANSPSRAKPPPRPSRRGSPGPPRCARPTASAPRLVPPRDAGGDGRPAGHLLRPVGERSRARRQFACWVAAPSGWSGGKRSGPRRAGGGGRHTANVCGLLGLLTSGADAERRAGPVAAALRCQRHRGPDESGTWNDADVVFGFNRLSIIDVANSHQPLSYADGRYTIVFNGEIYNYLELRDELA